MRKVKEILRLTYENGLSRRQVAQSVALGKHRSEYVRVCTGDDRERRPPA